MKFRSNHPEGFLRKYVLKICSKFIGEHPCQSVISTKLLYYVLDLHCEKIQIIWQFRISLILLWMSNYRSLQWKHNSIDLELFGTGFSVYFSPGPATILKKTLVQVFSNEFCLHSHNCCPENNSENTVALLPRNV